MADSYTPSRLGASNLVNTNEWTSRALHLVEFSGQVMQYFKTRTAFLDRFMSMSLRGAKSYKFPIVGRGPAAAFHVPGSELTGGEIAHGQREIAADRKLVADVFVDDLDEILAEYNSRSIYAQELGDKHAQAVDQFLARLLCLASRDAPTITGEDGGSTGGQGADDGIAAGRKDARLRNTSAGTDADSLISCVVAAAEILDEKNVFEQDRVLFVRPAQYHLLSMSPVTNASGNAGLVMNRDYAGSGSVAAGLAPMIDGITVVKTRNLPNSNLSGDVLGNNSAGTATNQPLPGVSGTNGNNYAGRFDRTIGVVAHRSALGSVYAYLPKVETDRQLNRLGTLIVAHQAMGAGILRPESVCEITSWDGAANLP